MPTPKTDWIRLEPPEYSLQPFGDPSTTDPGYDATIQIHGRGFGGPKTIWTEASST